MRSRSATSPSTETTPYAMSSCDQDDRGGQRRAARVRAPRSTPPRRSTRPRSSRSPRHRLGRARGSCAVVDDLRHGVGSAQVERLQRQLDRPPGNHGRCEGSGARILRLAGRTQHAVVQLSPAPVRRQLRVLVRQVCGQRDVRSVEPGAVGGVASPVDLLAPGIGGDEELRRRPGRRTATMSSEQTPCCTSPRVEPSVSAVTTPTRRPVNGPGPTPTATSVRSAIAAPAWAIASRIAGASSSPCAIAP